MDVIKQEFTNFCFTEICPGKTKTNMRYQNYLGTKTHEEIDQEYAVSTFLTPEAVANAVLFSIENKIQKIALNP